MTATEIIFGQICDPFRLILLGGLIYTMLRNRAATGTWIPLAAGILFIAALIPSTTSADQQASFIDQFWTGILSNLLVTAVISGLYETFQRLKSK